jgi:hypothetical protein
MMDTEQNIPCIFAIINNEREGAEVKLPKNQTVGICLSQVVPR